MTTNAELLLLLRRRDARGFELAYAAYAGRLLRFLRHLTGRDDLAEDLLQAVFLRLSERGPELRADSDVAAWLFTVARNAFLSDRRRPAEVPFDAILEPLAQPAPDVEARLLLGNVERALARLRVDDREVLLLIGVEGLQRETVARLLGVDLVALRKRLSRARGRLLAELSRDSESARSDRRAQP